MPLARNESLWHAASFAALKWCTGIGLGLGFLAGLAGLMSGGLSFSGTIVTGWTGVWSATLALGVAGLMFGCVLMLLFRALALASRR